MLSMTSQKVSSPRGIVGSYADMVSIGAMASNDWNETDISGLGAHEVSDISGVVKHMLLRDVVANNNCWRVSA